MSLRCIQINLHRAKAASAVLDKRFSTENFKIGFIQEPWTIEDCIKGLPSKSKLVYCTRSGRPRAALLLSNDVFCFPLTQFINRDTSAAIIDIGTDRGTKKIVVASVYLPPDESNLPPTPELVALINHCRAENLHIIIGLDANSHHTIWGSSDTRPRGESLLEFINSCDLQIVNIGKKPTYKHEGTGREEVLDLTLCSIQLHSFIKKWHVSSEPSLSDHRHLCFNIDIGHNPSHFIRIPKMTNWETFKFILEEKSRVFQSCTGNRNELDTATETLTSALLSAYELSCPTRRKKANDSVPWWSRRLEEMRKNVRRLSNYKRNPNKRLQYKAALTEYNMEIRKNKRKSFRSFCEEIDDLSQTTKIRKILCKDPLNGLGSLVRQDGSHTSSEKETLELLMSSHFPGCQTVQPSTNVAQEEPTCWSPEEKRGWEASETMFTGNRIRWAINSLKPYKSSGPDNIFPALLQKSLRIILPQLTRLFRWSFALSYIPNIWRGVKVVFIPKVGRDPENPKAYRPISLTSFLLKTMEKIIDSHLRNTALKNFPLNPTQHAYQRGKSTISALHQIVKKVENTLQNKEIALTAFLDIVGAFDNASHTSIRRVALKRGIEATTIKWICNMLSRRIITAKLGREVVTVTTIKGCPQGGVLSPLLWCLIMDDLLELLQQQGFETLGYADDLVLMVRGKHGPTISNRMQSALNLTCEWCENEGLNINPQKTTIIPFTKRLNIQLNSLTLSGVNLTLSQETKYLGVQLDKRLTWKSHIHKIKEKAIRNMMACKNLLGRRWGLKPKMVYWLYTSVIRPMISYASFVWWPKVEQTTARSELAKIQRIACLAITGAMRTTPTIALEAMLDLPPLQVFVKEEAALAAFRDIDRLQLKPGDLKGHLRIHEEFSKQMESNVISDLMEVRLNFDMPFDLIIPKRKEWLDGSLLFEPDALVYFTDGSRKDGKVGIGVTGPDTSITKALGSTPSIFQAEVHAIEVCIDRCLNRADIHGKRIYIASDSQAALKAIASPSIASRLVSDCLDSLINLASISEVTLLWVPGHIGIEGNEIADQLAKQGSEQLFIGPEPFCGFGLNNFKMNLKTWENVQKEASFQRLSQSSHSRDCIEYSRKRTQKFLQLNKAELSILTCLLTGHCGLKAHLHRIGKAHDQLCRLCMEEDETAKHLLCECIAVAKTRHSCLGKFFMNSDDIKQAEPTKILSFFNRLDLGSV